MKTALELDHGVPCQIQFVKYTPREPAISPFKPINRLLKIDRHNGTN